MTDIRKIGPLTSGAAVGGDGVATANTTSPIRINGLVIGFTVTYLGSPPATTDTTIATAGTADGHPALTLFTLTDANTNGFFPVQKNAYDTAGAAISGVYLFQPVDDFLKVTIAGANAADYVNVWAWVLG